MKETMIKGKGFIVLLAIITAVMLSLAGCNQSVPEVTGGPTSGTRTDPVTIQFWNRWTGEDGELLRELVDFYNQNNNDGVTVEMDIMEHASLTEKMAAALASNTAPELHLHFANGVYTVNGQTVPIDDFFEKTNVDKEDFFPDIMDQMYYDGHLFGLPFQINSHYLYWNKDLFEAAGLDPQTPPATYEELYEFSKKMSNPQKNIYGGGSGYNSYQNFAATMLAFGGGIVGGEDIGSFTSLLEDPKHRAGNLAALEYIKRLADEGLTPTFSGQDEMFCAGTLGMWITGTWLVGSCKEAEGLNWGISLMPAGPEGRAQCVTTAAFIVMKGTEGRELDACYQFLSYWQNNINNPYYEAGNAPVAQWNKELGYQPYLYSVANEETYISDPIVEVTSSYINHVEYYYPTSFYKFLDMGSEIIVPMMENVTLGVMSCEEALAEADQKLKKLIDSIE